MQINNGYTEVTVTSVEELIDFRNFDSVVSSPQITPKKVLCCCVRTNIKPL